MGNGVKREMWIERRLDVRLMHKMGFQHFDTFNVHFGCEKLFMRNIETKRYDKRKVSHFYLAIALPGSRLFV